MIQNPLNLKMNHQIIFYSPVSWGQPWLHENAISKNQTDHEAGKVAQRVKVLDAETEDLSVISRAHKVEARGHAHELSFDLHMHSVAQVCRPSPVNE